MSHPQSQVVHGHVVHSEDEPLERVPRATHPAAAPAGLLSGVGEVVRAALRVAALARRHSGPLALAAAPLARVVTGTAGRAPVALRVGGRDLAPDADLLARAHPGAGGHLLVLVPGAGEDERVWDGGVDRTGATYADRLAATLGWTPLVLRHDHGHEVAATGVVLASLLQRVVDGWPVPVERIALVAHGSGGLVVRAAGGLHASTDLGWQHLVSDVVLLGTPTLGVTAPSLSGAVGRQLDEQLAGIAVVDQVLLDAPPLGHARYVAVNDTVSTRADPLGGLVGGLLWWRHRTPGRPRQAHDLFPTADRFVVEAAGAPLVNHPEVHRALLDWLA